MTKKELAQREARKQEAIVSLRKILKPGSSVYTFTYNWLRRSSGCHMAVFASIKGRIENISGEVSTALGYKWLDRDAILVSSAYGVVASLSELLHGNENVGAGIKASRSGAYIEPDRHNYKAGCSLIHKSL